MFRYRLINKWASFRNRGVHFFVKRIYGCRPAFRDSEWERICYLVFLYFGLGTFPIKELFFLISSARWVAACSN